ncbi:MAG: hypothetical protein H6511_00755 [Holophagales bacterium]|nr:hypothetical protein [Holophagales bacterium]
MRRSLLGIVYCATFALLAALAWRGRDYYALALIERPHHPLHWQLKPGGTLGVAYGIAGLGAMTAMLGYSLRKRLRPLRRLGGLRAWLDFHIWCGIVGPLLILLHSALKVGGLIAIAFWSMVTVALSGVVGRFLYAQIPRTAAGDQLSLQEARALDAALRERLREPSGASAEDLDSLVGDEPPRGEPSVVASLVGLALEPFRFRARFARFRRSHPGVPRASLARLRSLALQRAILARRLALWNRLHELFHYWHVAHKPFALLMYLFAALHVGVAWATGYALMGGR